MKFLLSILMLLLTSGPLFAADAPHPFNVQDLVMMDRVSGPQPSPDGSKVAFRVSETDYAANKGVTSVWVLNLAQADAKLLKLSDGNSPHWSMDGKNIYFLSSKSGYSQLWRVAAAGGTPEQVSKYPLDINNFKLSPDGQHVLMSIDVFTDCADLACSKARLNARSKDKASGRLYTRLFIRHWDTWMDGRRSQLFIAGIDADGKLASDPVWLTRGLDGDIPSKPEGDDSE